MENILVWMKSTRSMIAVIFAIGAHAALFLGLLTPEVYAQALMLIIGAYFMKRDEKV